MPGQPGYLLGRLNADGTSDTSFNGTGWTLTSARYLNATSAMAIQADGKIVIGAASPFATGQPFTLLRYNKNGSLDTAFGSGGIATTDFSAYAAITALALQPDGRIIAAGYTGSSVNGMQRD